MQRSNRQHLKIEVARQEKAAVFGPHMENFKEESELLLENEAAIQVETWQGLIDTIMQLVDKPEELAAIGQRAKSIVLSRGDIARRYIDELAPYLR